jgi:hypothetical protein
MLFPLREVINNGNDDDDDDDDNDSDDIEDNNDDEHHPLICLHRQSGGASRGRWWWAPWPSPPLGPQRSILDDILLNRYSKSYLYLCICGLGANKNLEESTNTHKTPSKKKNHNCSSAYLRFCLRAKKITALGIVKSNLDALAPCVLKSSEPFF